MSLVTYRGNKWLMQESGVTISSRELADKFGKKHFHVLREIEDQSRIGCVDWIKESTYLDKKGESRKQYELTKDGFLLVAMGFTGEKAAKLRVEFIQAFNFLLDDHKKLLAKQRRQETMRQNRLYTEERVSLENGLPAIKEANEDIDAMEMMQRIYGV